ncbi:MAG: hypothetical protein ACXVHV_02240 [Methanobacterium sp.]
MGLLRKDSDGQIFSIDLLLALIPIALLLGMAASDMDNMFYLVQGTIFQSSTERVATDTVNTLVETSGSPYNWETNGSLSVVGLAKYDTNKNMSVENYLSPYKLNALQSQHIQNLLGPEYGFYLNLSRADNKAISLKTIGNYNNSAQNIVKVERLVVTSNLQLEASLEGLIRATGQPRTYTTTFQSNNVTVGAYDYWVLVINRGYDSASVDVNTNPVVSPDEIKHDTTEIKKLINDTYLKNQTQLMDNVVTVRGQSTPGNSMDVYIISAPKGTPESEINLENTKLRQCFFEFYVWVK